MALPLVGLVSSIASGWVGRAPIGYAITKVLGFFVKLGLYVAGTYFVYNLVQGQFNKFKVAFYQADQQILSLLALAKVDQAISIVISSILSGVLLKIGLRMFTGKGA